VQDLDRLTKTVQAFHEAEIRFVLIGGLALVAYGQAIITRDVDLVYAVDPENLGRIAAYLPTIRARVLGRPAGDGFVIQTSTLERVRFLNLSTDLGIVDLMRQVPGVDSFEGLWERASVLDLGGFEVRVASVDDLIAMKQAANRPKDQMHLPGLLELKRQIEEAKRDEKATG
jgi:predicted nucleotidyltransferase